MSQVLVSAKLDKTYSTICNATYGIAFFGTPHRGGDGARLGDIATGVARIWLRNPTNTFMGALKKHSAFADDLANDFWHQLEEYHILNFYETLPFKKLGRVSKEISPSIAESDGLQIVEPSSATLGLSGTRETRIAMNADHSRICKFENVNDDGYKQVIENLAELVDSATGLVSSSVTPESQ